MLKGVLKILQIENVPGVSFSIESSTMLVIILVTLQSFGANLIRRRQTELNELPLNLNIRKY